jgi:hypothetical protein
VERRRTEFRFFGFSACGFVSVFVLAGFCVGERYFIWQMSPATAALSVISYKTFYLQLICVSCAAGL